MIGENLTGQAVPKLESVQQLLFAAPLYAAFSVAEDPDVLWQLYRNHNLRIDGWCLACERETPFTLESTSIPGGDPTKNILKRVAIDQIQAQCTRCHKKYWYWFRFDRGVVMKVGQYPSHADIANDEVKSYRKLMPSEWSSEFHRAIGLAAHGVGVGSFVYLRRIFEKLIRRRFDENKQTDAWNDTDFSTMRMDEKINLLKNYLPAILVENRRVYSILSLGIHELSEEQCLGFFDVLKRGIILILDDERKAREAAKQRELFTKAISEFKPAK